jgi:hypothetical protein
MSPPNSVAINTYGIPGNGAIASTGGDGNYTNRGVPYDDRGHLDGARVEVISCECKLPAFATRDPSEGPLSRGVLDQVPPYAKKDCNVKHEAQESGHPFLNANKARRHVRVYSLLETNTYHHVFQAYLLRRVLLCDPAPSVSISRALGWTTCGIPEPCGAKVGTPGVPVLDCQRADGDDKGNEGPSQCKYPPLAPRRYTRPQE